VDAFLWIVIGLAGGAGVTTLMPRPEGRAISDLAKGKVVALIAAVLGGIGGGTLIRLLDPNPPAGSLTAAVGALAGGLLGSWISSIVSFRRRPGEGDEWRLAGPSAIEVQASASARTRDETRKALVRHLLDDATAHDTERYADLGQHLDVMQQSMSVADEPEPTNIRVAVVFWSGWIRARNLDWNRDDGVDKAEWPGLAREIATDLSVDRDISNQRVRSLFAARI
jgi:hypothetical protein